jgi:hypothetical protein
MDDALCGTVVRPLPSVSVPTKSVCISNVMLAGETPIRDPLIKRQGHDRDDRDREPDTRDGRTEREVDAVCSRL